MILPTVGYRRGAIEIIDQTLLPGEERIVRLVDVETAAEAIRSLRVRGAPAIGIAAAYTMLLALENLLKERVSPAPPYFFDGVEGARPIDAAGIDASEIRRVLSAAGAVLAATRPTAVNLFWVLRRMTSVSQEGALDPAALCARVAQEAFAIHAEELEVEYAIGRNGARFVRSGMGILTHCNAGGLATAGFGTALGVLYTAFEAGVRVHVYVDETRPLLQGARLTSWELAKRAIPHTILCDGAAASLFAAGKVDAAIVGADRIAANGDTANKVGTFNLAVLCEKYDKPLYVAAPWSTFDFEAMSGKEIPIEYRSPDEVTCVAGARIAPREAAVYNPAFDVTPANLIAAIITERGIIERPNLLAVRELAISG
jgi:methylthioribose-1-phosphate isomerase